MSSSVPARTATRLPHQRPRSRPADHFVADAPAVPATPTPQPCPACGQGLLTTLRMTLTDGTPAVFTSCRRCEAKRWTANGVDLTRDEVLTRTRKR
ncbi:MAG: hypothetical protein JWM67_3237 [Mycobacterium sp.]|nr:hypothetical protein [Mycobacterium sp.]